jgi:hypothetical protein
MSSRAVEFRSGNCLAKSHCFLPILGDHADLHTCFQQHISLSGLDWKRFLSHSQLQGDMFCGCYNQSAINLPFD